MKKILFAFQVFGLITAIPLVVVFEMNHGTGSLPVTFINTGIQQSAENDISLPANFQQQVSPGILSLLLTVVEGKQKVNCRHFKFQSCNCGSLCTCEATEQGVAKQFPVLRHIE